MLAAELENVRGVGWVSAYGQDILRNSVLGRQDAAQQRQHLLA